MKRLAGDKHSSLLTKKEKGLLEGNLVINFCHIKMTFQELKMMKKDKLGWNWTLLGFNFGHFF
jgi:hypothetical protein